MTHLPSSRSLCDNVFVCLCVCLLFSLRGTGRAKGRKAVEGISLDTDVLSGGSDELVANELADVLLGDGLLLGVISLGVGTGGDDVDLGDVGGDDLNAGLVLVGEVDGGSVDAIELDEVDVSGGLELELLAVDGLDGGNDVREDNAQS